MGIFGDDGDQRCMNCSGTGECPYCYGSGINMAIGAEEFRCPACQGTGWCANCETAEVSAGPEASEPAL